MSVDFPAPPSTRGVLMAIGGAEDKMKARRILNAFLTRAGGDQARPRRRVLPCPLSGFRGRRCGSYLD